MAELYITRPLPDRVWRARANAFNVTLREQTTPLKKGEMRAALVLYDVVLPTLGDMFTAEVFEGMDSARCKLLANFGWAITISTWPPPGGGHCRDQHARRRDRGHRRHRPDADADECAPRGRRRTHGAAGKWQGWHPTQMLGLHLGGQDLRHCRHGPDRAGDCPARALRAGDGGDLSQPLCQACEVPARQVGSLAELMGASDMVVIAVPGGADTRHLIGAEALAPCSPMRIWSTSRAATWWMRPPCRGAASRPDRGRGAGCV